MSADRISVGVETSFIYDLATTLNNTLEDKMNAVIAPLFHPRYKRDDRGISNARDGPGTRSDLVLDSQGWSTSVVGRISTWIRPDSTCYHTRAAAEIAWKQEIEWAVHLSVPAVVCPSPQWVTNISTKDEASLDKKLDAMMYASNTNYARLLNQSALQVQFLQFWVRIPLCYSNENTDMQDTDENDSFGSWEVWDDLRRSCSSNPKIGIALEITKDLPRASQLERWLGEPIRAVIVPTDIFLTNRKGYPTLSQRHQKFFHALFKYNTQFFIKGKSQHHGSTAGGPHRYLNYVQYLHYLFSVQKDERNSNVTAFEAPYLDYLQAPLQPLMDNLESQTYETFEQDVFKYNQYELAIKLALCNYRESGMDISNPFTLMVVGAGRGPLVRCSLRAAAEAEVPIRVFAVEKNPNAIITLRNLKVTEKWDNVTIVACDMRHWKTEEKADIMVSELLGSFGDNELSPECLDGAQSFLKESGISIPSSYTSFVSPIMSSKLWNKAHEREELNNHKWCETPYVVRFHNIYSLAQAKPVFTFQHPNWANSGRNRRFTELSFGLAENATIHGLAGYFEATLYDNVSLSINPDTHSPGMFSWFPIYFPLKTPMRVSKDEHLAVALWRETAQGKVWYEWQVKTSLSCQVSHIHNPNGRSYWIGL